MTDTAKNDTAALVEPGAPLSPARLARYSRQLANPGFGELAQRRLANARVLVVGAGGLGSATIPALAAMGVGTLGIVDTDVVELSNLHRQLAHGLADIGRSKLDSVADAVARTDPEITVHRHEIHLDSTNALGLFANYDIVLDGSDNFATRYLVNDAAALTGIPLVWGAILRYGGQASVAWEEHGPTYRDLFPVPPAPGSIPSCAEGGVLPSVCAVIGAIMCTETVKLLTGIGEPLLGIVTTYDALTGRFREISYSKIEGADPITQLIDYDAFCGVTESTESSHMTNSDSNTNTNTNDQSPPESRAREPRFFNPDTVDPRELATMLEGGGPLQLIDIREPFERSIAAIEPSELIPLGGLGGRLDDIQHDIPVVLYCHTGVRSGVALQMLQNAGFDNIRHLAGGIDAYSTSVDDHLTRY